MTIFSRYKVFFAYFSFALATSAIGFLSSLAMMYLISPNELGRVALFVSIQFLIGPVISFSAENMVSINRIKLGQVDYEYFIKNYISLGYLIFLIIQTGLIISFAFGIFNDSLFLLIPLAALLKYLIAIASMEYIIEERVKIYGYMQFFTALLSFVLSVTFLHFLNGVADWRILSILIPDMFFLGIRYRGKSKLLFSINLDGKQISKITKFGFPLLLSIGPAWLLNEADKMIIAKYQNITSVGHYAAACTIAGFMATFNVALVNATLPKLYDSLSRDSRPILTITKRYLLRHILISIIFAGFFSLVYFFLADIILPEKYSISKNIVYIVIICSLARSTYTILGAVTDFFGMTIERLIGIVVAGLTAGLVMIVGVSEYGLIGAPIGMALGYTLLGLILFQFIKNRI
jgi:O-antigen/teichoic acid export membrane protein